MKFAKELEHDLVPEWKIKYLNYKAGKKYVKGVRRAINRANGTPLVKGKKAGVPPGQNTPSLFSSPFATTAQRREAQGDSDDTDEEEPGNAAAATPRKDPLQHGSSPAVSVPPERHSLARSPGSEGNYGSFVPTPPGNPSILSTVARTNTFELPDPAIRVPSGGSDPRSQRPFGYTASPLGRSAMKRSTSYAPSSSNGHLSLPSRAGTAAPGTPGTPSPGKIRRLFSTGPGLSKVHSQRLDFGMQALDTVRQREREFFDFLDSELAKIETFYRQKEEQSSQRLELLREQLHEMRNRRTEELDQQRKEERQEAQTNPTINKFKKIAFSTGTNSTALAKMSRTPQIVAQRGDAERDYIRRPRELDSKKVPYRTAKRKLKLALQEFYRSLELLKSYAILNRTAFRKLNKKFDKAVNARPPYRYMNEKVNKAWFVTSDIVDGHIQAVEDLYARYFEGGNRKIAAGKLRRLTRRPGTGSWSSLQNGLCIGAGTVMAIEGLVTAKELLFSPDPTIREQTSYLLQLYGGYFLMLMLFSLFCLNCYLWTRNKVNYTFIFELDPRHRLDWRQLSMFPSFFFLLLSLIFRVNFSGAGSPYMHLWYPVVLIAITAFIVFLPVKAIWYRSRMWFVTSHFRLLLAGLFPVEFRDFFLGDMYCSMTYAVCNIELLFCLYAHHWDNPSLCNSGHSRLLGFFGALPPIWRALQCVRRYVDTRNAFPHLVNLGKYTMSILAAVMLSVYRIDGTDKSLSLFITFSVINSIYCSLWDLFMDFSFFQPDTRVRFLRDILAIKSRWVYYFIMVLDPILRFNWVFYAIFTFDKQHSTIVSFAVGLSEVTRRGMWALLRVENEHCGNVAQYKASRDVPLPYKSHADLFIHTPSDDEGLAQALGPDAPSSSTGGGPAAASGVASGSRTTGLQQPGSSSAAEGGSSTIRQRAKSDLRRARSIRGIMAEAHRQDFEKKRRPAGSIAEDDGAHLHGSHDPQSDDDDDDDDEDNFGEGSESSGEERNHHDMMRAEELVRGKGHSS